jgi:acyl-CoA synthetase (AMP-forming)/AMP-acid ligase II
LKRALSRGGETVYPAEVENAVLAHPGVADVAVFGVPDARWGEIVVAAIVLREGHTVEDDELESTVRARLAGFKVPKRIERLAALPRNGAGKVTKEVLRARFAPDDQAGPPTVSAAGDGSTGG